jgi:peptide/nickel transport system permease protein
VKWAAAPATDAAAHDTGTPAHRLRIAMGAFILNRLAWSLVTLFIISLVAFSLILLVPGDPARTFLGDNATDEQVEELRASLGLNDPFYERYLEWAGNAVQGDLGTSLLSDVSVSTQLMERIDVTLSIAAAALLLALLVGIPAGMVAALRRGHATDRIVTAASTLGIALPHFWIGLMLAFFVGVRAGWLPATGYVPLSEDPVAWLQHLILPAVTLSLTPMAEVARQLRASMINVLEQDYIRTARAMGLPRRSIRGRHALKNAATPVVTILGAQVALVFGGTVIVEQVFALPGLGQLALGAVLDRDYPVIQGVVLVSATVVMLANLAVDISYRWLSPHVRS